MFRALQGGQRGWSRVRGEWLEMRSGGHRGSGTFLLSERRGHGQVSEGGVTASDTFAKGPPGSSGENRPLGTGENPEAWEGSGSVSLEREGATTREGQVQLLGRVLRLKGDGIFIYLRCLLNLLETVSVSLQRLEM